MFSSALKSFSSNITSNYTLGSEPASRSGPWKIYDAKKKSTSAAASVFVFERKILEPQGSLRRSNSRSEAQSLKRAQDEAVERLRKEAASLARLRHPSILEIVEPTEDTRNGGIMFATELITASLAGLLAEKDQQERTGGAGGRGSRYVVEDPGDGGGRRRREVEIDELEIQKGLLQVGKGLQFLHESAGLVVCNLTPESIYINAKGDWKISGLGFCTPPPRSSIATSVAPIELEEILQYDPRLPRSVQLNFDYTSPDLAIDSNLTTSADIFSLGLLVVALYNTPHTSPLQTNQSMNAYKKAFLSSSTTPSMGNNYLASKPLPKPLSGQLLPRLLARRPEDRLSAREFQENPFFDNILVSTIRFIESLPAKAPNEKAQFMRGFPRIISQFPKSVLEKKVLSAFIDEMKDKELLALVLTNIFKIVATLPSGRRAFSEKVIPKLHEIFLSNSAATAKKDAQGSRDLSKEAGLMVILENVKTISESCSAKDFKDQILPIVHLGIESPTHSLVDASLRSIPTILPVLDFTTVKNDLFPVVASVFSKTTSLGIKVRGLEAFAVLCGAPEDDGSDGLTGMNTSSWPTSTNAGLDKFTVQEKIVPLMKAIKTKEPAVMIAALKVFTYISKIADADFLATDVLPSLWNMSMGPLLNLQQFQSFMTEIKMVSSRIEQEQTKKLQEMSSSSINGMNNSEMMSFGRVASPGTMAGLDGDGGGDDFEKLVLGQKTQQPQTDYIAPLMSQTEGSDVWAYSRPPVPPKESAPAFSWSTPSPSIANRQTDSGFSVPASSPAPISAFSSLQPSNLHNTSSFGQASSGLQNSSASFPVMTLQSSFSSPLQPLQTSPWSSNSTQTTVPPSGANYNAFSIPPAPASNHGTRPNLSNGFSTMSIAPNVPSSNLQVAGSQFSAFSIAPPPSNASPWAAPSPQPSIIRPNIPPGMPQANNGQKQGLDAWESLL